MEVNKPIFDEKRPGESHGGDVISHAKRPKPTRDRLSDLPNLALAHILSHLYTEEAARTSVLSKRFNSLWNSVAVLNFCDENSGKDGEFFVRFVDIALSLHRRRVIEKFSFKFRYDFMFKSSVDEWIEFAVQRKVKSLCLNLTQKKRSSNRFHIPRFEHNFPEFLYNNDNLVELVTCGCKFTIEGMINWSSLKLLSVSKTKMNEDLISRVLSGCPVLETLELREWSGFDKLKIDSVSLRVLKIDEEQHPVYVVRPGDDCSLEISGPNLLSLEVSGSIYRTKLRLCDLRCLANATMDFEIMPQGRHGRGSSSNYSRFVVRDQDIVREVLESLSFVNTLTLGGGCIKAVSTCEAYNLSSPWSERRSLTMCIPVIKWDHLAIASLLHSSPYLETLAIRLSHCSDMCTLLHASSNNCDVEYYWKSWSTISKCPLLHLKSVKVVGFRESCRSMKPVFQFLEFLLQKSSVLEEIVLRASRYVTQEVLDQGLKLLAVPTASPDVVVHFEPSYLWVDALCMYQKSALT